MKKAVTLIMILVLLALQTALAAPGITTIHDFDLRFAEAALETGSGHDLDLSDENRGDGDVNDVFQTFYNDSEVLMLTVPHGTDDVIGVMAMYVPDGDENDVLDYILLISEALYAAGITGSTNEMADILEQLEMMNHLEDGDSNKITVNGIDIGYSISTSIGIFFYIEI